MRTGRTGDRIRRARARRVFIVAGVSSVLLHVLLGLLVFVGGWWGGAPSMKKGEPLIVDIAPEKPEEKAPRGNPSRAVTAPQPEAPRSGPKAPPAKVAEAPKPMPPAPAAKPAAPAPAPPQQVAKAAEPPPAPKAPDPAPAPTPAPAAPSETATREAPRDTQPRGPSEATPEPPQPSPPGPQVARSSGGIDLPAAMLRRPPSGGGLQGGRGGVEGEPIPLDTPDPKYQDYFRILRERIQSKWSYPREAGDRGIGGALLIEFHIAKDGRLAYLEVRRSSGVEVLDEYAVNAVKLAQPFPPVPDNLAKQVLAINGNFVYHITENSLVKQFTR
jgi:TonB family protein